MINHFRKSRAIALTILSSLFMAVVVGCAQKQGLTPPVAQIIPKVDTLFGDARTDNYYWLREKTNPEVIKYINAEKAYTDSITAPQKGLESKLYNEMIGRLKETDTTASVKIDNYYYYTRTVKGLQYTIYCRKNGSLSAPEEILLDLNALAANYKYLELGAFAISPNQKLLAYSIDTSGAESFALFVKDLDANKLLADKIDNTSNTVVWVNDNKTFFYATLDATQRPYKLYRHILGADAKTDQLIYEEKNEAYFLNLSKTRSKQFLVMNLESNNTNELWVMDANTPDGKFKMVQPRLQDVKYYLDNNADKFLIMTNENAKNFKIMETPAAKPEKANWKEFIAQNDSIKIENIDAFKDYLVINERSGGLDKIRVMDFSNRKECYVDFPDPAYSIWTDQNPVYESKMLRFHYSSLVTPTSAFDYDMVANKLELIKQTQVTGYDKSKYESRRIFAKAPDGAMVPIALVFKKELYKNDGTNPMLLEGYGAYGIPSDPYFMSSALSLLDRGFVYALAQIRGGDEMGRVWYDQGKLLNKKNTFTDFIACAEQLLNDKYTSKEKLVITGASAGGILMGAVTNMRPELFKAVVANVPFVDVLNTMLDPTIPLTVTEYEEWGNPHDSTYYFYMKNYSPYDNVERKAYPNMLITGGLNDPRVAYWEPTKWTAKLRALKTDNSILLLKINMGEGHFGVSGRYAELKDTAFQDAFMLNVLGIKE